MPGRIDPLRRNQAGARQAADADSLPAPDIIATEIADDLEAALRHGIA